jgi:hypothetical protein
MRSRYSTIQLPRSFDDNPDGVQLLDQLARRSKLLRLDALRTNPEAYASSYEREILFTDKQWEDRVKNPSARTFVAVDCISPSTADLL